MGDPARDVHSPDLTLGALRAGQPKALAEICRTRGPMVLAYCERAVGPVKAPAAAADALARYRAALTTNGEHGRPTAELTLEQVTRRAAASRCPEVDDGPGTLRPPRACAGATKLITLWLEGAFSSENRGRFEQHLIDCAACKAITDAFASAETAFARPPQAALPLSIGLSMVDAMVLAAEVSAFDGDQETVREIARRELETATGGVRRTAQPRGLAGNEGHQRRPGPPIVPGAGVSSAQAPSPPATRVAQPARGAASGASVFRSRPRRPNPLRGFKGGSPKLASLRGRLALPRWDARRLRPAWSPRIPPALPLASLRRLGEAGGTELRRRVRSVSLVGARPPAGVVAVALGAVVVALVAGLTAWSLDDGSERQGLATPNAPQRAPAPAPLGTPQLTGSPLPLLPLLERPPVPLRR